MSERHPTELSPEERAFLERVAESYRAEPLGPAEVVAFRARLDARLETARRARERSRHRIIWGAPALAAAALCALLFLPRYFAAPVVPAGVQASLLIEYSGLETAVAQLGYLPEEYQLLSTLLDEPWNESDEES